MKQGKLLLSIAVASIASLPLGAIDTSRPLTQRIGILDTASSREAEIDKTIRKFLPRYLRESLTDAGFKVTMVGHTIEEMTEGTDDDILIDIGLAEATGEPLSTVGAGGSVEGVGVEGEISIIQATAFAEIRVYNARTLQPLTSLELNGEATQAAFTAIGLGLTIPIAPKGPLKQVARNIALDAAAAIREEFGR